MYSRYWIGLSDDYLKIAACHIRERRYDRAIDNLSRAISCANRAKDLSRAGRCCVAIRRLQWLVSKIPAAPATPAWLEAA